MNQENSGNVPEGNSFEIPLQDSGGRDTVALQAYEHSAPLPVGMNRYHWFEHQSDCAIYRHTPCDCAVVMWVIDVPPEKAAPARGLWARLFGRKRR
jgi:hypothetical protein